MSKHRSLLIVLDLVCWLALFAFLIYNQWYIPLLPLGVVFILHTKWVSDKVEELNGSVVHG